MNRDAPRVAPRLQSPRRLIRTSGVGNITITGWQMPTVGSGPGHHTSGDLTAQPTSTLSIQIGTGNLTILRR